MLYCDSHIHILPRMDNGPQRPEEAVAMLRILANAHTLKIIATPHFDPEQETIGAFLRRRKESFDLLRSVAPDSLSRMRTLLAAEVAICRGISRAPQIEKLMIPNTRCLLLSLPMNGFTKECVIEISHIMHKRKIIPIISSLERYFLMYSKEDYQKLVNLPNAVFQIGTTALGNRDIVYEAARLVNTGHTVLLGSNAHGAVRRPPFDAESENKIKTQCSETIFKILSLQTDAYFHHAFENA